MELGDETYGNIARRYQAEWGRRLDTDPLAKDIFVGINKKLAEETRPGLVSGKPGELKGRTKHNLQRDLNPYLWSPRIKR